MEEYIMALEALCFLLEKTGVSYWANWIAADIELARENSVDHHLRAYGGMGSLNDVVICTENNHAVTRKQEPWVNYLLGDLKGICYTEAKNIGRDIGSELVEKALWSQPKEIQGWRCLNCGYGRLSESDIENYIAPKLLKDMVLKAFAEKKLIDCVSRVLELDIPDRQAEVDRIKRLALRSGIHVDDSDSWLRPCPECGSDDTAVYRWIICKSVLAEEKMLPSEDNLKVKKR